MKNYYEILEISQKASQDIIDKIYKVQVKKYHPDLQSSPEGKAKCEAKIKEINEAYEVLGNKEKRAEYDEELAKIAEQKNSSTINHQTVQNQTNTSTSSNTAQHVYKTATPSNNSQTQSSTVNSQYDPEELQRRMKQQQQDYQNAINRAYHDAYIRDLRNRGYRIRYKKTWQDRVRSLVAIIITIGIIAIILQLPPVKNYFQSLYNENEIFRSIIDSITGWF